ncbi:hypothetical protein PVAND_007070 [Polypedilum vanderplanki]|uniref:Odorant binding protein n=1 Tax=Polypedilum vanderplanki TaxID=319348 RepID=A0A9J6C5W6_POLVA|nr:hypothetical protein PVAND_007070 [Polypedilum vanderplanki]
MTCILICLLILGCGFLASNILALKCVTPDGLQVDEVRKVIKKCMKKVTSDVDSDMLKIYDEYENFDDQQSEREVSGNDSARYRGNNRMNNYNNNYNPSRPRVGHNYDYYSQTGGNYRRNDRHDPSQYNPYQLTYGNNNNYNNNQRRNFHYNSNGQNKNNNDNSTAVAAVDIDKHERDRSCILQCFFQELKMTNDEGFPDRNRMISVLTKQLRDKELKDFYVDSIQECSRMVSLDEPKVQRDSCFYSKNLIICLTERAKMNCVDWNTDTVLF